MSDDSLEGKSDDTPTVEVRVYDQILDLEPPETGDDDAYPTEWVVEADRAGRRH